MLRYLIILGLLAGCQTDEAIQKVAPKACATAQAAYAGFIAADRGSEKTRDTVNAVYTQVYDLCKSPSTITSAQLLIVTAQTTVLIKAIRSAK